MLSAEGRLELVGARLDELLGHPLIDGEESEFLRILSVLLVDLRGAFEKADECGAGTGDVTVQTQSGSKTLRCHVLPLESGGHLIQVRDLRAIRTLVTDLRMASHHRNLTRLYMTTTHDLKGPLNAVELQAELLRRRIARLEVAEEDKDSTTATVETILSEVRRLQSMVEDALSETAPSLDDVHDVDLGDLCESIAHRGRSLARSHRVEVHTARSGQALVSVQPKQLTQVIMNLFVNACEAMEEGGRLVLRAEERGDESVLEIEDDGPGISDALRDSLFDLHATSKESGSGIGLWAARNTVEAYDGTLELVDTGPSGTTFAIRLPRAEDRREAQEAEA